MSCIVVYFWHDAIHQSVYLLLVSKTANPQPAPV